MTKLNIKVSSLSSRSPLEIKESLFLQSWDHFWVLVYSLYIPTSPISSWLFRNCISNSINTKILSSQPGTPISHCPSCLRRENKEARSNLKGAHQHKPLLVSFTSFCAAHSTAWEISNVNFSGEFFCQQCLLSNYIKVLNSPVFLLKFFFIEKWISCNSWLIVL